MLLVDLTEDGIVVTDVERALSPEHKSMLAYWRFRPNGQDRQIARSRHQNQGDIGEGDGVL